MCVCVCEEPYQQWIKEALRSPSFFLHFHEAPAQLNTDKEALIHHSNEQSSVQVRTRVHSLLRTTLDSGVLETEAQNGLEKVPQQLSRRFCCRSLFKMLLFILNSYNQKPTLRRMRSKYIWGRRSKPVITVVQT